MTKEIRAQVVRTLAMVHDEGLDELVQGNHAFVTLKRILTTNTSLPDKIKEPVELTEFTAQVFSDPKVWGIGDQRWKEFCEKWRTR